jgi:hypothetical protein
LNAISIPSMRGTGAILTGLCAIWSAFFATPLEGRAESVIRHEMPQIRLAALPRDEGLPTPPNSCGATTAAPSCRPGRPREARTEEDILPYDCACVTKSVTEKLAGYTSLPPAG